MSSESALRIGAMILNFAPDLIEVIEKLVDAIRNGERTRAMRLALKAATLAAYKKKIRGL